MEKRKTSFARINFFLLLPIFLISFLFIQGNVFAQEDLVKVEYTDSSIILNFESEEHYFKVYKTGELVYEGDRESFIDEDVEEVQNYMIGVFQEEDLIDIINIKTNKTPNQEDSSPMIARQTKSELTLEDSVHNSFIESYTSDNEVYLTWGEIPNNDGTYEIYRDEVLIGETEDLHFTDQDIVEDKRYRYEVRTNIEMDEDEKQDINKELNQREIELSKEQEQEVYYHTGILATIVDTPQINEEYLKSEPRIFKDEDVDITLASFPISEEYSFKYNTFIPQLSVPDPYSWGNYLMGDNRGFDPYSNSNRTSSSVNVGFWLPYMTHFTDIGESHRCSSSSCNNIIRSETASDNGIVHHQDIVTTSQMRWRINHNVGIPFGSLYPGITYYYDAELTRGGISIIGSHDRAPAHEFYMFSPATSSHITIHRHMVDSNWEFGFLLPGSPQLVWNFSM